MQTRFDYHHELVTAPESDFDEQSPTLLPQLNHVVSSVALYHTDRLGLGHGFGVSWLSVFIDLIN